MNKITKVLISIFIFSILITPAFSFAQIKTEYGTGITEGLVPCGRKVYPPGSTVKDIKGQQTYEDKVREIDEAFNKEAAALKPGETVKTDYQKQKDDYRKYLDTDISGDLVLNPCGFNDLMTLVNNIIHFILFYLAIPIVAIMFAYAGILLITAQGGESKTKAKSVFTHAALGLIIMVAAYIIIRTVLSILGYNGSWIGF